MLGEVTYTRNKYKKKKENEPWIFQRNFQRNVASKSSNFYSSTL